MFHHRRPGFLPQLPQLTFRSPPPTVEVAFRRNVDWQLAVRSVLRVSVSAESDAEVLDDVRIVESGPDPAVFRIRDHPLSLDGCRHHLQARVSAYRRNRRGSRGMLCAGGVERRNFSHEFGRSLRGVLAITIASFLFQPIRVWTQGRLDHFFYRDRLDYRRTLIEFGKTLTNEVRLDPMLSSVMDRVSQTLLVDRLAIFVEDVEASGKLRLARSMGVRVEDPLDLSFLEPSRPELARGALFFESPRAVRDVSRTVQSSLEQLDLNYYVPCRIREHCVAVLGLGKTVDGDFLSSDDVELVETIAGYVAVALDNAQLYNSLEQKALEIVRLKDFSENIVESLNVGVLAVDLNGLVESWNTRMEQLFGVSRQDAVGAQLRDLLPPELAAEIAARGDGEQITGIYKQRLQHQGKSLTLNVSITPLVSKSGDRIGRLLLFDDVTQRERMEEQMSQTEKLTSLGLLAAGVAHEVNTPLAVISNYIQMLAKQMPESDPRNSIIEKIVKQQ